MHPDNVAGASGADHDVTAAKVLANIEASAAGQAIPYPEVNGLARQAIWRAFRWRVAKYLATVLTAALAAFISVHELGAVRSWSVIGLVLVLVAAVTSSVVAGLIVHAIDASITRRHTPLPQAGTDA